MTKIRVEVVYALPGRQEVVGLELEPGATARDAVTASGIRGTDAHRAPLAVYGRQVEPGYRVREGDRVEVLRPLAEDPKEARRRRARRR